MTKLKCMIILLITFLNLQVQASEKVTLIYNCNSPEDGLRDISSPRAILSIVSTPKRTKACIYSLIYRGSKPEVIGESCGISKYFISENMLLDGFNDFSKKSGTSLPKSTKRFARLDIYEKGLTFKLLSNESPSNPEIFYICSNTEMEKTHNRIKVKESSVDKLIRKINKELGTL